MHSKIDALAPLTCLLDGWHTVGVSVQRAAVPSTFGSNDAASRKRSAIG
jgi:hypothetical protein